MKFHGWGEWILPYGLMVGFELIPDDLLEINGDESGFIIDLFVYRFFLTWQKEKPSEEGSS